MLTAEPAVPLSPEDAAQAARVAGHIRGVIADHGGWLPFSQFMQEALYAPGLGYYMSDRVRFGPQGDFVTAPELSTLYQDCLADGVAALLAAAGGGDVVEFGAGSGTLASGLAAALIARGAPLSRYRIVEVSPALRAAQQRRVSSRPDQSVRFEWLAVPPREPWRGVAFGNEVVDALPVDRFRVRDGGCEAVGVVARGEGFAWEARPGGVALGEAVARIQSELAQPMAEGYVSECRPNLRDWVAGAATGLSAGALLLLDYGLPRAQYYHPSRDGGTLCGFRRHRRVDDALATPGVQDLTAWVDFSALADAAAACGLELGGFATQAHFLISLGIERHLARSLERAVPREQRALRQDAATLLLPGEMGERFKAIAFTRGLPGSLPGFSFRDLRESL